MPKKYDKWLLIAVIIIAIFGIVMIYSASSIWAEYKFHQRWQRRCRYSWDSGFPVKESANL